MLLLVGLRLLLLLPRLIGRRGVIGEVNGNESGIADEGRSMSERVKVDLLIMRKLTITMGSQHQYILSLRYVED